MSRQSAASRPFSASSTRASIKPPPDVSDAERAEFASAVLGVRADHFVPADIPTIAAYARAVVAEQIADGELNACPVFGDRPSPWLTIWQGRLRAVATLARRLGLNPAGRQPFKSVEDREEPAPTSYYERMS